MIGGGDLLFFCFQFEMIWLPIGINYLVIIRGVGRTFSRGGGVVLNVNF